MALAEKDTELVEEMSIVDVFTKLIFDADAALDSSESLILDFLGQVDPGLMGAARRDTSEFLRAMSVDEMISLVAKVKRSMDKQQRLIAARNNQPQGHLRH